MCDYQRYHREQSGVKFCPTIYSVLVADNQATNTGKCFVGFRGCFLNAQYNRTNNIMLSNKCSICLFKMGSDKVVEMFRDCAGVVKSYHQIKPQFNFFMEKHCYHSFTRC